MKKNASRITDNDSTGDASFLFYFPTAEYPTDLDFLHAKYPHISLESVVENSA